MTPQTIDRFVNSSHETVSQDLQRTIKQAGAGSANGTETPPRQNQVRHVPAGTGPAYWGPGELMTFLITGEETGGAFFMADNLWCRAEVRRRTSTTARTNRSTCSKER